MSNHDPLPTEEERRRLCELMAHAFVELRYLTGQQAHDLAYAFHNLPLEIWGWGTWSVAGTRTRLAHYQSKHPRSMGEDYLARFDAIYPQAAA